MKYDRDRQRMRRDEVVRIGDHGGEAALHDLRREWRDHESGVDRLVGERKRDLRERKKLQVHVAEATSPTVFKILPIS